MDRKLCTGYREADFKRGNFGKDSEDQIYPHEAELLIRKFKISNNFEINNYIKKKNFN